MAVSTRLIKGRIKSVTNTRKITKAMELVAGAKMRKATQAVISSRPYAHLAWETIHSIAAQTEQKHELLEKRPTVKKEVLILITSDRGLCGGYNAQMLKKAGLYIKEQNHEVDVITIGRRGAEAVRRMGQNIVASYTDVADGAKTQDFVALAKMIMEDYQIEKYDKVSIGYTDYESAIVQTPNLIQLLPLEKPDDLGETGQTDHEERMATVAKEYVFEPSPEEVLKTMIPRIIETMIYQSILEASASEHSARMLAMRNATDAANDMIDQLTLTFNQARQAGITQEIAEISSGKAALE